NIPGFGLSGCHMPTSAASAEKTSNFKLQTSNFKPQTPNLCHCQLPTTNGSCLANDRDVAASCFAIFASSRALIAGSIPKIPQSLFVAATVLIHFHEQLYKVLLPVKCFKVLARLCANFFQ